MYRFFITKPTRIKTVMVYKECIKDVKTTGGRQFKIIFDNVKNYFRLLPKAIFIMIDGYAKFPKKPSFHINKIIWLITNNDITAPYGIVARL